jgi:hypothetical protein
MVAKNHIIAVGLACILALFGAWALYEFAFAPAAEKTPGENAPGSALIANSLDFGEVWEDARFKWVISVENQSAEEVRIDQFGASCICTEISPKSLAIPPGESRDLQLTINLTASGSKKGTAPPEIEDFAVDVKPYTRSDGNRVPLPEWQVKGKVKRVLYLAKPYVDLGKHSDRVQAIEPQNVTATACAPVTRLSFYSPSNFFAAEAKRDGKNFEIAIRPRGSLPPGLYIAEVAVTAYLADATALKSISIPVRLEVLADIQATPPQVLFGARKIGESCEEAIGLRSLTDMPFQVLGHRVEGINATVRAMEAREGAKNPVFLVAAEISQTGRHGGKVIFSVEAPDGKKSEIEVPVEFHGFSK